MARSGHVNKMARDGDAGHGPHRHHACMHSLYLDGVSVRQLRNGDTETVAAVFSRLSAESRLRRFGGPKPRLSPTELDALARVDAEHHVLVAFVDGDRRPAGPGPARPPRPGGPGAVQRPPPR